MGSWHTYAVSVNRSCGYRRRHFLLAGLAVVLSTPACSAVPGQSGSLDGTEVLRPVLKSARELVAAYKAAAASVPEAKKSLDVLRGNHSEHVKALEKLLGEPDEPARQLDGGSLAGLRRAESRAAKDAAKACVGAPDEFAVLLGEIAACRASHHDVLKVL